MDKKNWIKPKTDLSGHVWQISGQPKKDLDTLQKAIDDLVYPSGFARNILPIFTAEEVVEAKKAIESQIEVLKRDLSKYDKILKFIEDLPFKEGDAAFHKQHGNVLVSGVCLNDTIENSTYSIITKKGNSYQVPTEELVPISEATKVLFGKG